MAPKKHGVSEDTVTTRLVGPFPTAILGQRRRRKLKRTMREALQDGPVAAVVQAALDVGRHP
jgi:hypothetical protein